MKRYRTGGALVAALDDVSVTIGPGSMVAITGPSGSGKSTLLHLIGAMDVPDQGRIVVQGEDVTRLAPRRQAAYRRTIGFVFQRFHLLPALTALDNVAAPLIPYRTEFDKHERAAKLLAAVGLEGREESLPSELAGGEQQRVAIARALVNGPRLLLADEPTGNLDSQTGSEIVALLLELRASRGMTVLVATHNPLIASRCDRIVRLLDGRVRDDVPVVAETEAAKLVERISRYEP
ncbi:MAG TPA: ABC transporter ATP-binding protein [Gaiellaceae bacterium]|nr:ABC transporter ATP-binding protein [Gaiellaceae bacterium]